MKDGASSFRVKGEEYQGLFGMQALHRELSWSGKIMMKELLEK